MSSKKNRTVGVVLIMGIIAAGLFAGAILFPGDNGQSGDPQLAGDAPRAAPQTFSPNAAVSGKLGRYSSIVARTDARSIRVYARPSLHSHTRRLVQRRLGNARLPLVFLVRKRHGRWLQVHLPTRPNLSKGWIRQRDVAIARDDYRVEIQLKRHRLVAWKGARRIVTAAIGTGRSLTPTPTGTYFITDLIKPPDANGFYGPYAFGLSAHSPVLTSFEGGDGQVGIHGTNNPSVIGTNVSHGCIRVRNAVIRQLARRLPIGTPVRIKRV